MEEFDRYYLKAIHFLSFRPRSSKEVRENLQKTIAKRKLPIDVEKEHQAYIPKIIDKLTEQKFLNDYTFAAWWIEQRSRNKPKSQMLLKMELKQKGIGEDIIASVLSDEEIQTIADDFVLAKKIVEKKIHRYNDLSRQDVYKKLGGLLARRGFSWDVVKRSIDEALENSV